IRQLLDLAEECEAPGPVLRLEVGLDEIAANSQAVYFDPASPGETRDRGDVGHGLGSFVIIAVEAPGDGGDPIGEDQEDSPLALLRYVEHLLCAPVERPTIGVTGAEGDQAKTLQLSTTRHPRIQVSIDEHATGRGLFIRGVSPDRESDTTDPPDGL